MSIQFDETIRALYYVAGREQDWMGAINQQADGSVELTYRFRYYDPEDPDNDSWSGKDRKKWYEVKGKPGQPTLEKALETMQEIMDELQAKGYTPKGGPACKLIRGSMTVEQMFDEFSKLPFVHTKKEQPP